MRFTRSNGTTPWRVDCEDFGTSAAAAIVDTKTGKKVAFAVDQIALGFPDSYLNLSHGDLMLDALNVHEATGLTPSQLQARVAELEAALAAEREACAAICDEMAEHWSAYKDSALLNGDVELSNTASGEPRAAAALASLIRGRA